MSVTKNLGHAYRRGHLSDLGNKDPAENMEMLMTVKM